MEIKDFNQFYKIAKELAEIAFKQAKNSKFAILFARQKFKKFDLNKYFVVGYLSNKQINLLNAQTNLIKFSVDNMVKNIIKHPEITLQEYLMIKEYIKVPDKIAISKSNSNSIVLLKNNNKYYMLVIKTTHNKKENFLTSFRMLSENEFNKY